MKTILIIVGVTLICLVGFGAVNKITDAQDAATALVSSSNLLSISISGQVVKPGTYTVPVGSVLIDLITAGGGLTSDADLLAFNPDHALNSKESYYIAPLHDNTSTCSNELISKVNINTASAEELHAVAGFSKTTAAAVVSYRAGSLFDSLEQVKEVSGVGQATYITVRDHITIKDAV